MRRSTKICSEITLKPLKKISKVQYYHIASSKPFWKVFCPMRRYYKVIQLNSIKTSLKMRDVFYKTFRQGLSKKKKSASKRKNLEKLLTLMVKRERK